MNLPPRMKAVRLFEYGGPEVLQYVEVETPQPGPGEVAVKIHGATVSGFDLRYRSGTLKQFPGRPPFVLPFQFGREGAGEIAALGEGAERWSIGDRVVFMPSPACGHCVSCRRGEDVLCFNAGMLGQTRFGTQAEYVVVKETDLLRAPEGIPLQVLAGALHNFTTIWHAAFTRGRLKPGEDVMITGAGGGLGSAAIVLAKYAGARRIIAVTGVSEKADRLKALGATDVLNWRDQDVPAEARKLTGGAGVDLILDNVGGELVKLGMQSARLGARIVAAAMIAGPMVEINLAQVVGKHMDILGTRSSSRGEQETVLSLVGTGALEPVIGLVLPFADASEAHRRLESEGVIGKIVLVP